MSVFSKNQLNQLTQRADESVVVVPKDFCLFDHLSVKKNVALFLARQIGNQVAEEKSAQVLIDTDLFSLCDKFPVMLTNLEKAKLAILRGLVQGPDLLLIEEPFSRLNETQADDMISFINGLSIYTKAIGVVTSNQSYANQLMPQVIAY